MIKRSTWILLAILFLVIGTYLIIKTVPTKSTSPTPTAPGNAFLVTQSDGTLQSLKVTDSRNRSFRMQRDLSKTWVITAPTTGKADQALAEAAETQVGALRIVTTVITNPELNVIGLDKPSHLIELGFMSGSTHRIEVGNLTPTKSGYYVRYDDGSIYVISQAGIDALLNLLTAPPFPATETPSPTLESEATSTPEISTRLP